MSVVEQSEVGQLVHEPINPPRACTIGEGIMLGEWQAIMNTRLKADDWDVEEPAHPLEDILLCSVDQRAATVASSFIRWLGTNNGRCYISTSMGFRGVHGEDAFLVGWVLENSRKYAGRFRMITHLLTPSENFSNHGGLIPGGRIALVSDRDNEVVECVASWLGTARGLKYLERCEAMIKRQHDEHMKEIRDRLLAGRPEHSRACAGTTA